MLSYQNDPALKATFQARFAEHRRLDHLTQGTDFDATTQHGCFIGCTMNEYSHESFAKQIGPQWLAHLADTIFEGLAPADAAQFGTDLLEAIPVGKDLDGVKWPLAIARHERQLARLVGNPEPYAVQGRAAIEGVIAFCRGMAEGTFTTESAAWSAARSAARDEYKTERDTLLTLLRAI